MSLGFSLGACRFAIGFSCLALGTACCLFAGLENGGWLLLAMLLHEGGHLLALGAFRAPPRLVALSALGCRMELDPQKPLAPAQGAAVSLAGPGANLLAFGLLSLEGLGGHPFALANLGLGLLHSLPIPPLDGGLALGSLLRWRLGEDRAGRWGAALAVLFLFPLAAVGFLVLLRTRYNFSLLALSVYLMLYLVLKGEAPAP